jgi:hypothetical protein
LAARVADLHWPEAAPKTAGAKDHFAVQGEFLDGGRPWLLLLLELLDVLDAELLEVLQELADVW